MGWGPRLTVKDCKRVSFFTPSLSPQLIGFLDAEMIIKERQNNIKIILFNDFQRVTKLLANLTSGRCAALQQASVVPLLHPASAQVEDQLLRPADGQVLKKTCLLFRLHLPWLSTARTGGGWPWWRRWCWLSGQGNSLVHWHNLLKIANELTLEIPLY